MSADEKRRWRLDSATSTTDQTRDQFTLLEQQTILTVKQAFTTMLLAKSALKLAQDNLKDFRHELDISKSRYDAGDIGKLDYERLDLQLAQFETDESSAEANLSQASYQLQTLIGVDHPANNFDIAGDLFRPRSAHRSSIWSRRRWERARITKQLKMQFGWRTPT